MAKFIRHDGRAAGELRPIRITPDFVRKAAGSCLIEMGRTRVICTASFVPGVPEWREKSGLGWMTAEYGMLPASTGSRKARPGAKPDGRGVEIQRIIGRVLRNAVALEHLGQNTLYLDCDVLEADGGTRTAAINGAYVALARAIGASARQGKCSERALGSAVAAVSVGIVGSLCVLDLDYPEDSAADVDMNVAMAGPRRSRRVLSAGSGQAGKCRFVEIQGSSEREPFDGEQLRAMLRLAEAGIRKIMPLQRAAIAAK